MRMAYRGNSFVFCYSSSDTLILDLEALHQRFLPVRQSLDEGRN